MRYPPFAVYCVLIKPGQCQSAMTPIPVHVAPIATGSSHIVYTVEVTALHASFILLAVKIQTQPVIHSKKLSDTRKTIITWKLFELA